MAALTIRWTRQAIADVDHIYEFIAKSNAAAARAMVDRIDRAINDLVAHPRMGRAGRITGSRELVVAGTPYIVAYRLRLGGRAQMSRFTTFSALFWMNSRRGSTTSPMRVAKISSAASACSTLTW
jgi:toxin ParE1/3/4